MDQKQDKILNSKAMETLGIGPDTEEIPAMMLCRSLMKDVLPFEKDTENDLIAPAFVTVGQTTALRLSMETGHHPDNPCPSGEVNRVVKGVTIYPYK